MNSLREITSKMPRKIAGQMNLLPDSVTREVEEIRFRCGQKICLRCGIRERYLQHTITQQDLHDTLNQLIQYSYYAYEADLARGFVTIEGGHRVGICGRAVIKEGQPALLQEISSLNIRFAREVRGCSRKLLPEILENGRPVNTLIISPPGCGKTTLLRDLARELSECRFQVGICDERSEIAGMFHGRPSFDLGPRCDVLDGCDKAWGISMLLRSMAPQVIFTDEIGKPEDISAVMQCLASGVALITSIHGWDREDVCRSAVGKLVEKGIFRRLVFLSNENGAGTIRDIVDTSAIDREAQYA